MGQDWSKAYTDAYINYITWDGAKFSAKPEGSNFVIAPDGDWTKAHPAPLINYLTVDNGQWSAKPNGNGFTIAPDGDGSKDIRRLLSTT